MIYNLVHFSAPKIKLENAKGLKDADVVKLQNSLATEAARLLETGEVMIYELCQYVQEFLHEHNVPPESKRVSESFYDAMLKSQRLQTSELDEKERKRQEQIQSEVNKRREQLLKENRARRATNSESSPRHVSSNSSEDSRHLNEICDEHRGSETIYVPSCGKKIQLGCCLGHSQKGCINYSGIDLSTGQLYYITVWTVKYSQLEAKGLTPDTVVNMVESKINDVTKLRHRNLMYYECVMCAKRKDHLQIFIVQEFLQGISISSISGVLGWSSESASMVAKSVLDSLIYLHNNGISHGNLLDASVFMDCFGVIRVTDYCFVPYIQELISNDKLTPDLPALGALIESLMPTPTLEMREFVSLCRSERTLSGSELVDHPFLFSTFADQNSCTPEDTKGVVKVKTERPHSIAVTQQVPLMHLASVTTDYSRLNQEFDVINFIGKGAYGDVLKVRNKLDNRQYALKRIPLSANSKQLYKKMTREVELLSRLNHENVVRYFNSWTEIQLSNAKNGNESEDMSDFSCSGKRPMVRTKSQNRLPVAAAVADDSSSDESSSSHWNNYLYRDDDSSSSDDGIEFVDSDGKVAEYQNDESHSAKGGSGNGNNNNTAAEVIRKNMILYIQMEFCEKSTLRTAIDANLFQDKERVWKMFREIVEGLTHIHQQGMIHRDLKPVNVFLDSKDHVKIGDFGLATTSVLALQHQQIEVSKSQNQNLVESHTGQVGTALYVAPELEGNASKSTYNQKVDLYSLGIIFFEMITPPFETAMERIMTIKALRTVDVTMPKSLLADDRLKNEVALLKWLLDHNPTRRPTSEELLQSELLPPVKLEAYELQEMLRHVLANPQSRSYKHLIARCLAQESDLVCQMTYHLGIVPISSIFENVKNQIVQILRKHAAIDVSTPLLHPFTKSTPAEHAVKLMCNSGSVVTLPYDLRQPFLRHVAINGITSLRRYTIGRVYREKKVFNFHPKQNYECAFDIVTPNRGNFLVDAELIATAHEIVNQFDVLKQKNITFRINHTSLLRAIFFFYSVPKEKYKPLLHLINEYLEDKVSKLNVKEAVRNLLPVVKDQMLDILLMTDLTVESINSSLLRTLVKGRGEASALAKGAVRELESLVTLCRNLGVTSTAIHLCVGMSCGYDCSRPGSVMWQMMAEMKPGKLTVLACGGRYDNEIEDQRKCATLAGFSLVSREMHCAGFSLSVDKLVLCLTQAAAAESSNVHRAVVDLVIYVVGTRPPLKEITHILRSLWTAGIKCCFTEVPVLREDDDLYARDLGANHIIVLGEDGYLKVKSWLNGRYSERNVTKMEIVEYLKKNLNADVAAPVVEQNTMLTRNNSITGFSSKIYEAPVAGLPKLDINFLTQERLTLNKRKRLENQIEQKLGNVMEKFNKKETFTVFAVELDVKQIKLLISCIDPNPKDHFASEIDSVMER